MQQFKEAVAAWVVRFVGQLAPMTPALGDFVQRPASHAVALVPGRMVDAAEDMLTLWMRNDPKGGATKPHKLPVVLVAVAREVNPTQPGRNRALSAPVKVTLPGDAQERVFELRTQVRDYRVQVLFVAQDSDSVESMAQQFVMWIENWRHQTFDVMWQFAGVPVAWPAQLDSSDVLPSLIPSDAKNLHMVAVDVSFCTTQPLYRAFGGEGEGLEANRPGSAVDAQGFPLVGQVQARQFKGASALLVGLDGVSRDE